MPPDLVESLVDTLRDAGLLTPAQAAEVKGGPAGPAADPGAVCGELVRRGWLTPFQAEAAAAGRAADLVLGPYLLLDRVGAGGMGEVFKARHAVMDRVVALKVIRPDRLAGAEAAERFRREVRAAARVSHPNVVTAHDAAEVNGVHFYAMEYLDGVDLHRLVRQAGPLPVGLAAECGRQAALGLDHARRQGLVHRDVKPANLMLCSGPDAGGVVVKVLDLGLARAGAGDPTEGELTRDGAVVGTPDYIAPEQGDDPRGADTRADVYSLGCTLYHLLTGKPPFPGGGLLDKLARHREIDPVPVRVLQADVPPGLAAVLARMTAKRPAHRYQTPGEVAAALAPFASAAVAVPHAPGPEPPARPVTVPVSTVDDSRAESADDLPGSAFSDLAAAEGESAATRRRRPPRRWAVAAGLLGLVALLAAGGVYFFAKLKSADGKTEVNILAEVTVDLDDKAQAYSLDGVPVTAEELRKPVRLDPGRHEFVVARNRAVERRYVIEVGRDVAGGFRIAEEPKPAAGPPPKPPADPDRAAAEWVTGKGGNVRVVVGDLPRAWAEVLPLPSVKRADDLPAGPFRVVAVAFPENGCTDDDLKRLAGLPLRGVWMPRCPVGDAGLKHLAGHRDLLQLQLDGTRVTDGGLEHLKGISGLVELQLQNTAVTGTGLEHLGPLPLATLNVSPAVTDAGLERIGRLTALDYLSVAGPFTDRGLRHLDRLDPRVLGVKSAGVTDEGLAVVRGFRRLEVLHVLDGGLADDGLTALAGLDKLREVALVYTRVTDAGLAHLKAFPALRAVQLEGDRFTDAGVKHLAALAGLEDLRLQHTRVGDPAVDDLARLANLKVLILTGSKVSADGLRRLRAALPGCRIVPAPPADPPDDPDRDRAATEWVLARGGLVRVLRPGQVGPANLAELLRWPEIGRGQDLPPGPFRLISIVVGGGVLGDADMARFAGVPLQQLWARGNPLTDAGLAHLRGNTTLRFLMLDHCPRVTDAGLEHLAAAKRLENLSAWGTGITGTGCRHLREAPLDSLLVGDLTDAGLEQLAALPKLAVIHTTSARTLSDAGLSRLAGRGLKVLVLVDAPRLTDGAARTVRTLAQLEVLDLTDVGLTDEGVNRLAGLPRLHTLTLHTTRATDARLAVVKDLPALRTLRLTGGWVTDAGVKHLAAVPTLTSLRLRATGVGDGAVDDLAGLTGLTELDLTGSGVTGDGLRRLKAALPDCRITPAPPAGGDPPRGARPAPDPDRTAAEQVIAAGCTVRVARPDQLPGSRVALEGPPDIGRAVDLPPGRFRVYGISGPAGDELLGRLTRVSLQLAWIPRGGLTDRGMVHLGAHRRLRVLNLDNTRVTDAGFEHLAGCADLEELSVASPGLTGTGYRHLRGTRLGRLATPVTDAGLEEVARLPHLRVLNCGGPGVTDAGLRHLGHADLVALRFGGAPKVTDAGVRELRALGRLELLELGNVGLTDNGLKELVGLEKLQTLILYPTKLTDAGLAHLKDFPALKNVYLHGPWATDAGVKHLAAVPGLRDVRLAETRAGDGAVDDLAKLTGLRILNVAGNRFTPAGVERLRAALPGCEVFPAPPAGPKP